MKSLKTRLAAAFGAAAIVLSVPFMASAGGGDDHDFLDLKAAILNVPALCASLLNGGVVDSSKIYILEADDVTANVLEDIVINNLVNGPVGQINGGLLNNLAQNLQVKDGVDILTFGDFLSGNDVDVDAGELIAVEKLLNGDILVWKCGELCD